MIADFVQAHDVAVEIARQGGSLAAQQHQMMLASAWQEYNEIGQSKDSDGRLKYPRFGELNRRMVELVADDKADDWDRAYAIAAREVVDKAKRARPIKTSSSASVGSSAPRGLDNILNAAIG